MTRRNQFLVLAAAAAVHAAALAAFDTAMVDTAQRQQLSQQQPERIVVTGPGVARRTLANQSCPAPRG
jgi:NAD(P)H-hydrate repair Nnr-like enzyme with NAD(P)H-hydrate dehydratase domain